MATVITVIRSPSIIPAKNSHSRGISQPNVVYDDTTLGEGSNELANDIELHAERIRQERISKRAKQQQEAEAALTRGHAPTTTAPDLPLVGNLIGEDHVNYVLMYNMLTGIRIGVRFLCFDYDQHGLKFNQVSRCQAKIKRTLADEDFTARHKFSFDMFVCLVFPYFFTSHLFAVSATS